MADSWGGSWGKSWGVSWGAGEEPKPDTIHPTGGEPLYLKDEEDLLLIINNFLFMVNHDRD